MLTNNLERPGKLVISTLIFPALLLSGCFDSSEETHNSAYYHRVEGSTLRVQEGFTIPRQFVGRVHAMEQADIGFEFAGKVANVEVDEGETVVKGQLLASLDTKLLELQDQQLSEQYRQTEADLNLVVSNLKRLQSLQSKGYTSTQSVDELITRRDSLSANLQRISSLRDSNQTQRDKSRLLAPFSGTISHREVSPGEVMNPGLKAFSLLKDQAEIKVGVPLRLRETVNRQTLFTVLIDGQSHTASLLTQGAQVDPVTHTIQLRLKLSTEQWLYDGQLAYLQLDEALSQSGYWVPLTALTDGMRGMWNLYVLVPDRSDLHRIERRDIRVHYADELNAFVKGAITDGEQLVSAGVHRLAAGQLVRLNSQHLLAERAP